MRIVVLVKEVPDTYGDRKLDLETGLADRGASEAVLRFTSPVFQHRFAFDLPGLAHTSSDNYFELYPREPKDVVPTFARPVTREKILRVLATRSLADTYA